MIREHVGALGGARPTGGAGTAVDADETCIRGVRSGKVGRGARRSSSVRWSAAET